MDQLFAELYAVEPVTAARIQQLAKSIRLLICDVDGVFSDGRIYLANSGEELKAFNTRDGFGIKALQSAGIDVAIITGRHSELVERRMKSLAVKHIYQGQENKLDAFHQLLSQLSLSAENVAYIGDDIPDLAVMNQCGFAISVADGHPYVKLKADYICQTAAGSGAVREICDLLLISNGYFNQFDGSSS